MNFGPSAAGLTGGLSKTVGIRKDLIRAGWQMGDGVFCPLFTSGRAYADGVPQQDFPVKVASRSTPWAQAGKAP
jgi:hypothetical protein